MIDNPRNKLQRASKRASAYQLSFTDIDYLFFLQTFGMVL
jgi:hypothetical protein